MAALDTAGEPKFDFEHYVRVRAHGAGHLDLMVSGVHCANCIAKIENGLRSLAGVNDARLNFSTGKLSVDFNRAVVSADKIAGQIKTLGYSTAPYDPDVLLNTISDEGRTLIRSIAIAGIGVVFVAGLTDTFIFGATDMGPATLALMRWLSALIGIPITLYVSTIFFRSALKSLAAGSANMDVPISLAILISLGLSLYVTLIGGAATYYDAAVMLPFLLLIGRYLDYQVRRKARGAALDLIAMQAVQATRLNSGGGTEAIAAGMLTPGDRILLATGERSPVDGTLESATEADLSLVTGETSPASLPAGGLLHAGSTITGSAVVLKVTAKVSDSLVAELVRLIEAGQQQRSRYVRLADHAAALYVPVVHSLALAVFLAWLLLLHAGLEQSLTNGVALLIVTCPCALGLAVPVVQVVATGQLFRKGVLVKSGDALERLAEIDGVVFDKTGTLTEGRPVLLNKDRIDPETLHAAAELARVSRHPLARALAMADPDGLVAKDAREVAGCGVLREHDGVLEQLGSAAWLGFDQDDSNTSSELCYRKGDDAVVRFVFGDRIRSDARTTVAALRRMALRVSMLSGDRDAVARTVAGDVGIAQWKAGVNPAGKVDELNRLQAAGQRLLMIGDGLNDAAALASAHVSMSPASAIDAAQAQSDIVLRGAALFPAVQTIAMARLARRRALQNFAIAALYNAIAIPIAAMGLVTPLVASVAMASSSLIVTLNALRLSVPETREQ
jgi:Cu2+-exporting ATPase